MKDLRSRIKVFLSKKYPNIQIEEKGDFLHFSEIGKSYEDIGESLKNEFPSIFFNLKPNKNGFLMEWEDSKKREVHEKDHRGIGKNLKIFDFDPLIGAGMPIWLEKGYLIKEEIKNYINRIQRNNGITIVSTPELGKKELYQTSGHWDHYQENMFPSLSLEGEGEYILRPMTCPHHIILYKKQKRHEKQLPIAFGENARLHRYEYSGGLFGLERTRCMELIDTHLFCAKGQIFESLNKVFRIIQDMKEAFEIEYHSIVLSLRDVKNKDKFFNDENLWNLSENSLKEFLNNKKIEYVEGIGDAAFYGPKIDFQIKTYAGKIITISTIQLDFSLPKKFELKYTGCDEKDYEPIMIHVGIIGTLERFIAYLLERNNGWLPFWLSPIQITLIPVNKDSHLDSVKKLENFYKSKNIRVEVDQSDLSLGKKIAKAIEKRSFGFMIVGDKEAQELNISDPKHLNKIAKMGWESQMSRITKSRNKELNRKVSEEKYPKDHIDFLRWAYEK
ncbi:Threonyl-tRNA synthetase [Mycoplasma haemocanis str. Illinois]|uniref:Threonine--tRNA ligase n=1 Tax=Mycoplasma haemocanis (strain Illinois) TaxID=1111676 RepID=H6N5X6_MYCHN|nr:threonine--tRNA ligase [Mycoplasma haemocanis]AEW44891.1 Threonyl-tRNA synthetase [Mycoplasma haemocanis str. Illinois]